MKTFVLMSVLAVSAVSLAHAEIRYPDQSYVEVLCHEDSGLPNGLSLSISSGGYAGMTLASLTYRGGIGPYESLGTIAVTRKPVPAHRVGAGVTYVGKDFELNICSDCAPTKGGMYSHVYADIAGKVFNQPMVCDFMAHTL